MNKEPQQVDWSQQKPGTKAISRDSTNNFEFVEARSEKACFFNLETRNWEIRLLNGKHTESTRHSLDDILLPWESCIAEGHNPDGLTNGQVGEGWRLLKVGEEVPKCAEFYVEAWCLIDSRRAGNLFSHAHVAHRVPITPTLAPVPAGKATKRVPCGPEHFPPGVVIRTTDRKHWQMVMWSRLNGIGGYGASLDPQEKTYEALMNEVERSIDGGKTWLPCYVEVEA